MTKKATTFRSEIAEALARQFKGMWNMLCQAIENVPDKNWAQGTEDKSWFYSLRVFHIIETADFYSRDTPEGMEWGKRLGIIEWWKKISHEEAAKKLQKADMLDYLKQLEQRIDRGLRRHSVESLQKGDGFHWFHSILEKYEYLLRHNTFHLGELALRLREWGSERIKWT